VIRLHRLLAQIKREKSKLDIVFATCGVAKYAPSCTRAAEPIITVPLGFLFPALSQFLKEPQQDQPFLF
jgi:hypothetical protein